MQSFLPSNLWNLKLQKLGYVSVFYVTFDRRRSVDEPGIDMWIDMGGGPMRFRFLPLSKTHFAILPRQLEAPKGS